MGRPESCLRAETGSSFGKKYRRSGGIGPDCRNIRKTVGMRFLIPWKNIAGSLWTFMGRVCKICNSSELLLNLHAPDGAPPRHESRLLRAFGAPAIAAGIRNPGCRPACSYRLARPMSVRWVVQARPSAQPPSGAFIVKYWYILKLPDGYHEKGERTDA